MKISGTTSPKIAKYLVNISTIRLVFSWIAWESGLLFDPNKINFSLMKSLTESKLERIQDYHMRLLTVS